MSTSIRYLAGAAIFTALFSASVHAQSCKPEVAWKHEHAKAEADTITDDIKGTRATRIEVCRDKEASETGLAVELQFAGSHGSRALPAGTCLNKLAKWAVIKSRDKQASDGVPKTAQGSYKICRE